MIKDVTQIVRICMIFASRGYPPDDELLSQVSDLRYGKKLPPRHLWWSDMFAAVTTELGLTDEEREVAKSKIFAPNKLPVS